MRSPECIESDKDITGQWHCVRISNTSGPLRDETHDRRENCATDNRHDDEGSSDLGVFAEAFNAKCEDCWIHNGHEEAR